MDNFVKEKILIVDDSESITALIQSLLEDSGYDAITCQNASEAINYAVEYRPDLILLDIMMPGIDGYTICAQLKADTKTKDIPIIFLSALNSSFDKVKAFKCGAVDFVPKPVQNDELMARVNTHLTISQLNRTLLNNNRDLESKIKERTKSLETETENLRYLNSLLEQTLVKYRNKSERNASIIPFRKDILEDIKHEFKNPLQSIYGFAGLLSEDGVSPDKVKEYASIIEKCSKFIVNSLDTIINYAITAYNLSAPNPIEVNVSDILEEVYANFANKAETKNLKLTLEDKLASDCIFYTDKKMLQGILQNILDCAVEFTNEGSIDINASYANGNFIFYIKDTGMGINPEKMDIIFKPFVLANSKRAKEHLFTIVGLGLAKNYVDLLRGQIWFDSTPGKGTEFYISLPSDALLQNNNDKQTFEDKTVLVADDDDMSYILLYEVLKSTGINIKRVQDGRELFETFRQIHPEIVITNLKLPVINGTEALKMIKTMSPKTICIAQMPYFSAVDQRDYSASMCDDFIEKPAKQDQIIAVLNKYLN